MRTASRLLLLFCLGLVLAYLCAAVIGWFAAIAWERETYRAVARGQLTSFLVLTLAMAALPAALLAGAVSFALSRVWPVPKLLAVAVLSLPWFALLLLPPSMGGNFWARVAQSLTDLHTVVVMLAVPAGLSLGLAVPRRLDPFARAPHG